MIIVLGINISSSSSADRRKCTGYLNLTKKKMTLLKIRWIANLQFKEVLKEKEGKPVSSNEKIVQKKTQSEWKPNEGKNGSYTRI